MSTDNLNSYRYVLIGASAGGFRAVVQCLGGFRGRENVVFVVVLHGYSESPETLAAHLEKLIDMPVSYADHGMKPKGGQLYLSRPDHHLMIKDGLFYLTSGPKENLFRPSIDVLFRSFAVSYGNRTIGVLLTGRLSDGTLGLSAIKRCGGITIVQDPATAEYADMPQYAQRSVDPDYSVRLDDMQRLFSVLFDNPLPPPKEIPEVLKKEVAITSHIGRLMNGEEEKEYEGEQPLSCPSCGGPLALMEDETVHHYRCKTGHSFTLQSLDEGQGRQMEEALWIALRILDERIVLLKKMINDYDRKGLDMLSKSNHKKLKEVEKNATQLKKLMGLNE